MGGLSEREYGVIYLEQGGNVRAHRIAYEMTKGLIPEGLVIDHLCRVHCCVNPDHLEAVTQLENVRRGVRFKGRRISGLPVRKCQKEYARRYRQSQKGKAAKRRELDKRKVRRANGENIG
jgi:hypothetical protein